MMGSPLKSTTRLLYPKDVTPFSNKKIEVSCGRKFVDDVFHIPWRKKLSFLYIHRFARF